MNIGCQILSSWFIGVLLLTPTPLFAQTLIDEAPPEYEEPLETWVLPEEVEESPFHRQRFEDTYSDRIFAGQIYSVAKEMVTAFDSLDWQANERDKRKIMNQLLLFLDALEVALHAPGIEGSLDLKAEQNIFLKTLGQQEFGLNSLQKDSVLDGNGEDVPGYFRDTPNELPLYQWEDGGIRLLLAPAHVRQWRLLENSLTSLVRDQTLLVSAANIRTLEHAVIRWENFLDKGYSQMPWESLLNGWWVDAPGAPEFGPPGHQWIICHPTLGFDVYVDSRDAMRGKEALYLEMFGRIWYYGELDEDYWGFSAALSLREDANPGFGAMVHIMRNWSMGITWHEKDDPNFFISTDLFKIANRQAPQYVSQYRETLALLNAN